MDFFGRQEQARRASRLLVALFLLAVAAVVAVVSLVVLAVLGAVDPAAAREPLPVVGWTAAAVGGVIGTASLFRLATLRAGGGRVAVELGGQRVLPGTGDPLRRRLLNVVEEMAIASGLPVPEVYVLENEAGINAFAAGWSEADAAIGVTRGLLEALDRAELQGVIGHEFSHILNGDMRLNTRLLGLLFGLMVVALVGRLVLFHLPRGGRRGRGGAAVLVVGAAALAVLAAGQIGLVVGRLLQAGVSRSRERLADAAAVQFTRDPAGLRNALVKIGASQYGSRIVQPEAEEVAHMLFAPLRRSAFATHPPLLERIRALDPAFDPAGFGAMRRTLDARRAAGEAAAAPDLAPAAAGPLPLDVAGLTVAAGAAQVAGRVGNPGQPDLAHAGALRASLPPVLAQAATSPREAAGLLLALALEREPAVRERQLRFIGGQGSVPGAGSARRWLALTDGLSILQRMPVLLSILPETHRLTADERRQLLGALTALMHREGSQISPFAYALRKLAQTYLRDGHGGPPAGGSLSRAAALPDVRLLLAVLARFGNGDEAAARQAFSRGMARWGAGGQFAPPDNWPARLDEALSRLDRLAPADKAGLVAALVETVSHDGRLTLEEAELLRAVCAALHCPLPPFLPEAPVQ